MAKKTDVIEMMRSTATGRWFWHLVGPNGEVLAHHNEEYDSKRNCMNTVKALRRRNPTLGFRLLA